jgi:hypothetical protein
VQGTVTSFEVQAVSPERIQGDMRIKQVTVRASVRAEDGRTTERTLTVTLEKATTATAVGAVYDGWIVTAVSDVPPSRAIPRS